MATPLSGRRLGGPEGAKPRPQIVPAPNHGGGGEAGPGPTGTHARLWRPPLETRVRLDAVGRRHRPHSPPTRPDPPPPTQTPNQPRPPGRQSTLRPAHALPYGHQVPQRHPALLALSDRSSSARLSVHHPL